MATHHTCALSAILICMKYLVLALLFFSLSELSAQTIGIINDPDGYTNIRNGQGSNFEIIGKIEESYQFKYYPNEQSNWWAIKTIPSYGTQIEGFVHKSRIQPYYPETSIICNCPQPYNPEDAKPVLNVIIDNTNLSVCGFLLQRQSPNSIKITEFTISNCETNEVLRFYDAVTTCQVRSTANSLEITELERLPVGSGFQWIQTPLKKVILSDVSGTPKFGDEQFALDLSNITDTDISSFVGELPNYKGKGYFKEIETFIGKLLVCSLKGNEQCETIFKEVESYLNFELGGHYKEFYNKCKSVLENRKSR